MQLAQNRLMNETLITTPPPAARSPRALSVRSFGLTDPGRVRDTNEDHFLIAQLTKAMRIQQTSLREPAARFSDERGYLFLVADGMGGAKAGELASALAVAAVEHFTLNTFKWFFESNGPDAQKVLAELQTALRQADADIAEAAERNPALEGMGTTLTLAYHLDAELCVVHVGDSRAYVFRDDTLHQLTHDHTLVADMVRRGEVAPEDASQHRFRHVITNVVGGRERGVHVEAHALDLQAGDRLILCSDGLTEMMTDDRLAELLRANSDPEAACAALVAEANANGGRDNVTVIVALFE
jgi:PPM family protein phosphatase